MRRTVVIATQETSVSGRDKAVNRNSTPVSVTTCSREGYRFSGRYLFLREFPDGAVTRLHASAGAVLECVAVELTEAVA